MGKSVTRDIPDLQPVTQTKMGGPCLWCENGFITHRSHAKTCSAKCRVAYNREKRRVASLAPSTKKKPPSTPANGRKPRPTKPPPKRKIGRKR